MSRTSERVMWIMVGAAIGAGIALLYAPKTGKDTRKYLRKRASHARETLLEAGETVVDAGRELYTNVADTVVERGRGAYDTVVEAGREAYRRGAAAAAGAAQSTAGVFTRSRAAE